MRPAAALHNSVVALPDRSERSGGALVRKLPRNLGRPASTTHGTPAETDCPSAAVLATDERRGRDPNPPLVGTMNSGHRAGSRDPRIPPALWRLSRSKPLARWSDCPSGPPGEGNSGVGKRRRIRRSGMAAARGLEDDGAQPGVASLGRRALSRRPFHLVVAC